MNEEEVLEQITDEAFGLLADQPSLRSMVDEVIVEQTELRATLARIETKLDMLLSIDSSILKD